MPNQSKILPQKPKKSSDSPSNEITIDSLIQQRIQAWKEKSIKDQTGIDLKAIQHAEAENTFCTQHDLSSDIDPKTHSKSDVINSLYFAISGSGNEAYTNRFVGEVSAAMITNQDEKGATAALNSLLGGMVSMSPQDAFEAQLCAKLMVLQSKAMHFMNKATNQTDRKHIDNNINNATKCMRLHNDTLETLNRHRRNGEQRVKVVHQYVQVNEGGQAVVTGEAPRGGGKQKK